MKGYISQQQIVRISEKVDIVEIISRYVNLKKSGKNYKALCPFHSEKTPSFFVSPDKQIFHCFGCGIGGDVFKFLMNIENISFPEAVIKLAKEVGEEIHLEEKFTKNKQTEEIIKANEFALKSYSDYLFSPQGKMAFEYLYNRNFDDTWIKTFYLGYAPYEKNFLVRKIKEKKLEKTPFINAGLLSEDGETDFFRNRIIFPIFNWREEVVGFGARTIEENVEPKYLNSRENIIFNKSRLLYGINWAKEEIKEKNYVIIVEGYFDVLKLMMNNLKNVVAPMGTSLTEEHLKFLKRYTDKILLVFDSDSAGISASLRSLENILKNGFEVKLCPMPTGFDPDKFIDEFGIDSFINLLNSSQNFIDFVINVESQNINPETPRGKSTIVKKVSKLISLIPDEIEKEEYVKYLSDKVNVEKEIIREYVEQNEEVEEKREFKQTSIKPDAEFFLLKIALSDPDYMEKLATSKDNLTERLKKIVEVYEELANQNIKPTVSCIIRNLVNDDVQLANFLSHISLDEFDLSDEKKEKIFYDCLGKIEEKVLKDRLKKMKEEINDINNHQLLVEIQSLIYQLKKRRQNGQKEKKSN